MRYVLGLVAALTMTAGLSAQPKKATKQQIENIAGTWRITCETCPAGALLLDLKTDGKKIAGKFNSQAVLGHIENGKVAFAQPNTWRAYREQALGAEDASDMYMTLSFVEEIRGDGTLVGYSEVFIRGYGPMSIKRTNWTARRVIVK